MTKKSTRRANPPEYCEVALPVPLEQPFTYSLPTEVRAAARPGCRVLVTFRRATLPGVIVGVHRNRPDFKVRSVKRLLDEEPSLGRELLDLGRWIARYYCTPFGEVLKSMLPLRGQTRRKKVVSLTADGRAVLEATVIAVDLDAEVLASLANRSLTLPYLSRKHPGAGDAVRRLEKRGLVRVRVVVETRDPTMARGAELAVELGDAALAPARLGAGERWLLEFLRRNPGRHDLRALSVERRDAVPTARRLARTGAVVLDATHRYGDPAPPRERVKLTRSQENALNAVVGAIRESRFKTFLLHGVTGSGKTEVYVRAIEEALALGRCSLLLVPEISLTPALASEFLARFGDRMAVLHSALNDSQRSDQWHRIRDGRARIVLGTRSAVFAPVPDLGLVVVDEEHDGSYKQSTAPRYNGRDVAIVRARAADAPVVLGSATPGIETRHNARTGKYTLLSMPTRIMERPLPAVRNVDMRREFTETGKTLLFSRAMIQAVQGCLGRGEQAMILLNRRGFSTYVLCRSCGHRVECPNCSVTLTYHKRNTHLLCHYCDRSEAVPNRCTECGKQYLHFHGSGSERVEEELERHFPNARIARLDRDTVRGRDSYETILGGFRRGDSNLLVGTQMIAKGHDIPNVTLVCVVDADVGLGRPDFRAAERTFQLLTQVAGRAGRGDKPGQVLIQTMNPDHYAVELASRQDYEAFYRRETGFRKAFWYPPFTSLALIVVRNASLSEAAAMSAELAEHLQPPPDGLRLVGPATAPMVKLRTEYRFQFLIKSVSRGAVAQVLARARRFAERRQWPATALIVDVDPVEFL